MDEPTQQETTTIVIDLQDIAILRELIEVSATRGIIHPRTFITLGNVYAKLDKIIQVNSKQ